MDRDSFLRLVRASSSLTLTCETLHAIDMMPPRAERPLRFAMRVAGGACTYLSPTGSAFTAVDAPAHERLLSLAESVLAAGSHPPAVDTALARDLTTLRLSVEGAPDGARTVTCGINHLVATREIDAPAWVALLLAFADLAAPHTAEDLAVWTFVMRACDLSLVAPQLDASRAVPLLPRTCAWNVPLRPRGLYLRLGQPPHDSPLYRLAATDHGVEVRPVESPGIEGEPVATLRFEAGVTARWAPTAGASPYRGPSEPEVEVFLVGNGAVLVRAGAQGRGVFLQRA